MLKSPFEIGCLGKLPLYEEFIRYHADAPEVDFLDSWLREGINLWNSREGEVFDQNYDETPPYFFFLHLKNSKRMLLGVFILSRDKGGRKNPFTIFILINHKKFNYNQIYLPIIFSPFLKSAAELAQHGWKDKDINQFLKQVDMLNSRIPENPKKYQDSFISYLDTNTNLTFWSSLYGSFEDSRRNLVWQNLIQILLPLRQLKIQKFSLGLKFPLDSKNESDAFEIPFWLYLAGRLYGSSITTPILFWNRQPENSQAGMFLFLQPPTPENFLYLVNPDLEDEKLCVLDRDGANQQESLQGSLNKLSGDLQSTLHKLITSPEITLREILQASI